MSEQPQLWWNSRKKADHKWYWDAEEQVSIGIIELPEGIVFGKRFTGANGDKVTVLTFVWQGRRYFREWREFHSNRRCVTLAKRLVADVLED